jgi:hypothetical protein
MVLNTDRRTVDLSAFPDLVVIHLGMRVNELKGLKTLLRFGPKITKSVAEQPDGLLLHENIIFSVLLPTAACASTGATSSPWTEVGTLAAARGVVGAVRARHGGHGVLARAVLYARWDGGCLPQHGRAPRLPEFRACRACPRGHVLGQGSAQGGRRGAERRARDRGRVVLWGVRVR